MDELVGGVSRFRQLTCESLELEQEAVKLREDGKYLEANEALLLACLRQREALAWLRRSMEVKQESVGANARWR